MFMKKKLQNVIIKLLNVNTQPHIRPIIKSIFMKVIIFKKAADLTMVNLEAEVQRGF